MAKTILNVKTDVDVKKQAQQIAREIGVPLSTVVNAYLKEFVRERSVKFSLDPEPRQEVAHVLKKASVDYAKDRNVSKRFRRAADALAYLHR